MYIQSFAVDCKELLDLKINLFNLVSQIEDWNTNDIKNLNQITNDINVIAKKNPYILECVSEIGDYIDFG